MGVVQVSWMKVKCPTPRLERSVLCVMESRLSVSPVDDVESGL